MFKAIQVFLIVGLLQAGFIASAYADICVSEKEAVDIIVLLDASEKDLQKLGACRQLVKELYTELTTKDAKIVSLTDEIVKANKEIIKYKGKYDTVKKVAIFSSVLSGILVVIQLAPLL
jgi:hypothetical protein